MYQHVFTIEELPKTLNVTLRMHFRARAKYVTHWYNLMHWACMGNLPKKPLTRASLSFIRHSSTEGDYDGIVGSFKFPLDGLVSCGVLEDDNSRVILERHYSWQKASPKKGKIVISVRELE